MKNTHLSLDDKITISHMLSDQYTFKQIALAVGKNCTSISREVRNHIVFKKTEGYGRCYNACRHRIGCPHTSLCPSCSYTKKKLCSFCENCSSNCPHFLLESCPLPDKPPYICNGCQKKHRCTLEKRFYNAASAHKEYRDFPSESRSGPSYSEEELKRLDAIIAPLILRGQSLNHICANNRDFLLVSESTL